MKIKRLKKLKVNSYDFEIIWDKSIYGASFDYASLRIVIGTKDTDSILDCINHELMGICACEMHVRLSRDDCDSDYIFVYDHRQFTTMMRMFTGLQAQFIE